MGEQVDARLNGDVAQLGEHLPCKQGVESSNLFISTQDFPNARTKDADIGGSLLPDIEADVDAYEDSRDRGTCSEGSGKTALGKSGWNRKISKMGL